MVEKNVKRFLVLGILGLFMIFMMGAVMGVDYKIPVDNKFPLLEGEADTDTTDVVIVNSFNSLLMDARDWSSDSLKFTKISENADEYSPWLYAFLLGMIIYTVISMFFAGSSGWIKWGITGSITAIAMIGIPPEIYKVLEVNYGAMGSAILAIIPFVIILFFTMRVGSVMIARGTWVFFGFYSLMISWSKFSEAAAGAGWPYLIGFVGSIFMFWSVRFWRDKFFQEELKGQLEIAQKRSAIRSAWRNQQEAEAKGEAGLG